jgi:hypothetical protein
MRAAAVVTAALVLCSAPPAPAASVGVGAAKDNTLIESATGHLSNGAGPHLYVGTTGTGNTRRGVIAFDVALAVPRYSLVHAGTLTLAGSRTSSNATVIDVHRLTAGWGEGTSNAGSPGGLGAPATIGDATWLHRTFDNALWDAQGGDFVADASASASIVGLGADSWPSTPALVADVQRWLDQPTTNFGWLLKAADESLAGNAKRFDTREIEVPANRPSLTIDFTIGGDANHDDAVNMLDFDALAAHFGQAAATWEQGDFTGDGTVNLRDFNVLATNFGISFTAAGGSGARVTPDDWSALHAFVPEPSLAPALLIGLTLKRRRRLN